MSYHKIHRLSVALAIGAFALATLGACASDGEPSGPSTPVTTCAPGGTVKVLTAEGDEVSVIVTRCGS